jgi:hypothetical protein
MDETSGLARRLGRLRSLVAGAGSLRRLGLTAALLAAIVIFAVSVDRHYPIREWLFWRYAAYWVATLVLLVSCLSVGHLMLHRLVRLRLRLDVHLLFALALGVFAFYLAMFAGGLLHLYGWAFALLLPAALLASGIVPLVRHVRPRVRRLVRLARARDGVGPWRVLAALFGLAGLAMVYFVILTPDNVAYDARWYHLSIAEHYAAQGFVGRFDEGWFQGTFPHLASFLFCWAFLLPGTALFDRIVLSAHLEFALLLATLVGIAALVRWLVRGRGANVSWAALFLFPGIFLYDSSLTAAADHIAAFWAPPIWLALARAWPRLQPRACALLAVFAAGALSTKYQAMSLLALPAAAVVFRAGQLLIRTRRDRPLRALAGPGLAAAVGAVLTAPHWLKNWVWYGDPFYPFMHKIFAGRPWTQDSAHLVESIFKGEQMWVPRGTLGERLAQTGQALFTFSFIPHDWPTFHGMVPVFGSLFTLSLLALPFLRGTRRVWPLVLAAQLGVLVWFVTSHQDRYLQIVLPWMAAVTAATVALVWRVGRLPRAALAALVGLQIVWGADVYFFPTHAIVADTPLKPAIALMSSGHRKDYRDRFRRLGDFYEVGRKLPPKAKVLVHESHVHLGLDAPSVSDWSGWQGGISYGRLKSPRGVYQALRDLGVTHLVWYRGDRDWDSYAGDMLFFDFAERWTVNHQNAGGLVLAEMPAAPPALARWNDRVAYLACPGRYTPGLYRMDQLALPLVGPPTAPFPPPLEPPSPARPEDLVERAGYVVLDARCHSLPPAHAASFTPIKRRGTVQLFVRASNR